MANHTEQYMEFCRLSEELEAPELLLGAIAETQRRLTAEAAIAMGVSSSRLWRRYSQPSSHYELCYMGCNKVSASARCPDDGSEIHSFDIHEAVVRGDLDAYTTLIKAEMNVVVAAAKKARDAEITKLRNRLAILESPR